MKCSVCGKEFGFWEKLQSNSNTVSCKECHEQAKNRLNVLIASVGDAQSFKSDYANGWIHQFEDTVRAYRVGEPEAAALRSVLLNHIFKLVEAEPEMADADLQFLANLVHTYRINESTTAEIRDTLSRIGVRQIIQSWERGQAPQKQCTGLMLQKNELCHWEEPAALRIQRTQREYVGNYSSVSVPIPLIRGARFRVGGYRGHPIDTTTWENGGAGILHVTSQRICFTGQLKAVAIPYDKVISIGGFDDGFIVQTTNEKKPGVFAVANPELTTHLITLAYSSSVQVPLQTKRTKPTLPAA
jgi:hypothetical protein